MASEHGTFAPDAKDEGKSNNKGKSKEPSDSEDDSTDDIRQYLRKNKKPTTKVSKKKDALFRMKWWRIVLGRYLLADYDGFV